MKFILGKKLGMTTIYEADGGAQNVTMVECAPSLVTVVRTMEKDGYSAVQMEIAKTRRKNLKKEFRLKGEEKNELKNGDQVTVEIFQVGDVVNISGITKAKGFQGVVKRHGFAGAPHSHGRKHDWRKPGSIGCGFPEHVIKGKKMAGRMGGERSTVQNLKIVYIDKAKNLLAVKGAVPGVIGRIVEVRG